mmetsp:Transcript_34677/g.60982  ORF Transcript_34677/g.60982 Transcript_34677/m.60982 type:complete len:80 (-) Transcript_34677:26-265(-)
MRLLRMVAQATRDLAKETKEALVLGLGQPMRHDYVSLLAKQFKGSYCTLSWLQSHAKLAGQHMHSRLVVKPQAQRSCPI